MVVDGDPESLASHFRILRGRGFRVATYSSPVPACGYAALEKPAAIVMAFGFSECDGATAVRRLKDASPRSRILVRPQAAGRSSVGDVVKAGAEVLAGAAGPEAVLRHLEGTLGGPLPVPVGP
jgi:CheY-like chemotaxis protein